jgi:hypothetical protein
MDKIAPSFSFHIDAGQQSSHGVSVPLLIQVIENAQNAVELIGCDVEGKEFKQRVKIPTRISRKYQLICQVPVTGSYAMPMTLGDPGSDLFVFEDIDRAWKTFSALLESVMDARIGFVKRYRTAH